MMDVAEIRDWIQVLTGWPPNTPTLRAFEDISFGGIHTGVAALMEGVWLPTGVFAEPATGGEQLEVISSSGSDIGPAGAGMRRLRFHYLAADGTSLYEDITLNGLNPVAFSASNMAHAQFAHGLEYGTLKRASGNITIRTVAAGTTVEYIAQGQHASASARRTVPADESWFVLGIEARSAQGTGAYVFLEHDYDAAADAFLDAVRPTAQPLHAADGRSAAMDFRPPLWLKAGTRVQVNAARVGATNAPLVVRVSAIKLLEIQP